MIDFGSNNFYILVKKYEYPPSQLNAFSSVG